MNEATRIVGGLWILAQLTLGGGGRVGAQVSCFHGRHRLPAGVVTGFPFTNSLEHVIESQDMSHLMNHDVGVARHAIIGWIENYATCNGRFGGKKNL